MVARISQYLQKSVHYQLMHGNTEGQINHQYKQEYICGVLHFEDWKKNVCNFKDNLKKIMNLLTCGLYTKQDTFMHGLSINLLSSLDNFVKFEKYYQKCICRQGIRKQADHNPIYYQLKRKCNHCNVIGLFRRKNWTWNTSCPSPTRHYLPYLGLTQHQPLGNQPALNS